MKDDAFRWAMYKNGQKVPCICGPDKEQVWDSFLAMETELSRQAAEAENTKNGNQNAKGKIYTMMQKPLFEQLGYSVEESKVWRLAHGDT